MILFYCVSNVPGTLFITALSKRLNAVELPGAMAIRLGGAAAHCIGCFEETQDVRHSMQHGRRRRQRHQIRWRMLCLTAAVIDHYRPGFRQIESVDYGISAAQQTNRGLATTSAVLSYVGKPFTTMKDGRWQSVYGWQDMHAKRYPELGIRLFGNCDIPDLDLFPSRYPEIRTMRFAAGHELKILHFGTWMLSWLVRIGLIRSLADHSEKLLRLAFVFDRLGSSRSGFHMYLAGVGTDGSPRQARFYLIARSGHGPYIPCMPAILLARKLARDAIQTRGAMPCVDLISLDEYLAALKGLDISVVSDSVDA